MPPFHAYAHLLRLAALFAAGIALFLGARALLVPADYGELGPYRAGALAQNLALPIVHAGQVACVSCHGDVAEVRQANAHAGVSCESCHGALAAHADDPALPPAWLDPRATCAACHAADPAKPRWFKTVRPADHADEAACTTCHPAHAPRPW